MAIPCPYCSHSISVKSPKPGKFKPKCPKCAGFFLLSISTDDPPAMKATALPNAGQPSAEATAPPTVAPVKLGDETSPRPPVDPNLTSPPTVAPVAKRPPALDATVAPSEGVSTAGNADFSVSPSVNDATMADLGGEARSAVDATEAGESGPMPSADDFRDPSEMPAHLGGYQIVKELGRGGMGAVYLARQVSLDRPVALKVMNPEWAANPNFLVRFTREAYAAAQLLHHNVVQVYDIGNDKGVNYFSMEFVEGCSLGDEVKKAVLAPDVAAGYVLQAARGLKFAHDRGMIHRDIKPDNLMLNTAGVVKVADLGLVRTPGMEESPDLGTQERQAIDEAMIKSRASTGRTLSSLSGLTMAGQAMGTPAYMAPEQARDATKCDHRADIYSLGCTLYVLVTGTAVFGGKTPMEVMTRHQTDVPKPPTAVNKDVPKALSDVILKMIAKKPDERYQTMDDVVRALEDFLGLHGAGKQAATEQHLRTLESGVKSFNSVGLATIRDWSVFGFLTGCGLLGILLLFTSWPTAGSFFLALGLSTGLGYFAVHGAMERSPLFLKLRDVMGGTSWLELGKIAGGLILFLLVLFVLGQLWVWMGAAILGIGLAFGIHYGLDKPIAAKRASAVEKVDRMLKTLRMRGLSEEALEEFVAKYSGDHWEEFYEALFGYEKKMAARLKHGAGPKGSRPKWGAWRDGLMARLDGVMKSRQEAKEKAHLQAVEQKGLEAQGVDAAAAKAQAAAVAGAMVEKAAEIKKAPPVEDEFATVAPEQSKALPVDDKRGKAPPPKRVNVQDLFQVADKPAETPKPQSHAVEDFLKLLFGGSTRFVIGGLLLLVSLFWMYSRDALPKGDLDTGSYYTGWWKSVQEAKPLEVPGVPEAVMKALCSAGTFAAGVLMLLSTLWGSWKIGLFQMLAAAVLVIGPVSGMVPEVAGLSPLVLCLAAGGALSLLGFVFGRDT